MGNYTPVGITYFPGKTPDWAPMEGVSRQMNDKKVTDKSHTVGDETSCLVDEERVVDFSEAFDNISRNILVDKLSSYGLDG